MIKYYYYKLNIIIILNLNIIDAYFPKEKYEYRFSIYPQFNTECMLILSSKFSIFYDSS